MGIIGTSVVHAINRTRSLLYCSSDMQFLTQFPIFLADFNLRWLILYFYFELFKTLQVPQTAWPRKLDEPFGPGIGHLDSSTSFM
jgi:hypothetical protein